MINQKRIVNFFNLQFGLEIILHSHKQYTQWHMTKHIKEIIQIEFNLKCNMLIQLSHV